MAELGPRLVGVGGAVTLGSVIPAFWLGCLSALFTVAVRLRFTLVFFALVFFTLAFFALRFLVMRLPRSLFQPSRTTRFAFRSGLRHSPLLTVGGGPIAAAFRWANPQQSEQMRTD